MSFQRVLIIVFISCFALGCGDDPSNPSDADVSGDGANDTGDSEEISGTLEGTITFVGEPEPVGQVFVIMHEPNPPSGPPEAISDDIGLGADGEAVDFTLSGIDMGTYGFVAVYWEDPNDPDMETKFHDLSTDIPENVEPLTFTEEQPSLTLNLTADWSKVGDIEEPIDTGTLTGNVSFVGTPPVDNGRVIVGVHPVYPPSGPPTGITEIPMGTDGEVHSYRIEGLYFGTFGCIAVYWDEPFASMTTRYHDISTFDPELLESIEFSEESPEATRDLVADWSLFQ